MGVRTDRTQSVCWRKPSWKAKHIPFLLSCSGMAELLGWQEVRYSGRV